MTKLPIPFAPGSDTSRAAAESLEPIKGGLRQQVMQFIAAAGPRGVTDHEIEVGLRMKQASAVARRNDLMKLGRVVKTDDKRRNPSGHLARVYVSAGIRGPLPKEEQDKQKHHVSVYLTHDEFVKLERERKELNPAPSRSEFIRERVTLHDVKEVLAPFRHSRWRIERTGNRVEMLRDLVDLVNGYERGAGLHLCKTQPSLLPAFSWNRTSVQDHMTAWADQLEGTLPPGTCTDRSGGE